MQAWTVVSGPVVLFLDTFTGADGTDITSRFPDIYYSGGWVKYGTPTAVIQSNQLALQTGGEVYAEMGQANIIATMTVYLSGNGATGLLARTSAFTLSWLVSVGRQVGNLRVIIYEKNPGFTQRAAATGGAQATGTPIAVTASCRGDVLTCDAVGDAGTTANVSYTSALNNSVTRHGLRSSDTDKIDTFQVVAA